MTKIDPEPVGDPTQSIVVTAETTIKVVEVAEGTKDAFQMDGRWLLKQDCKIGDTIQEFKSPPGQPPHAMHTAWGDDGMPDPKSEIYFPAGDGWVDPNAEQK